MLKIFSFFLIMISANVFSQSTQEYKTEKGESLKDVAKKFSIDYSDLKKANPNVSKRPKENTSIQIPKEALSFDEEVKKANEFEIHEKNEFTNHQEQDSLIIHVVQPKETLYGLSKQYDVPVSEIIKENLTLSVEGLKIGQELKIPTKVKKEELVAQYLNHHTVQPKETWYGISKLYNISIEELKKMNPQVALNGLKIGSILEIPNLGNSSIIQPFREAENTHVMLEGETLYSVSKSYGTSVDELLQANGTIVLDSITVGTILQLPTKVKKQKELSTAIPFYKKIPITYTYNPNFDNLKSLMRDYHVSKESLESFNPSMDSIVNYGGDLVIGYNKKHQLFGTKELFKDSIVTDSKIKVMLMLPFDFKKNDTLSKEQLFSNSKGLPTYVSEFYMGAEIAIDLLRKQNIQVSFKVIDTEKNINSLRNKINSCKEYAPDLIIGPLYSSNAVYVAKRFSETPVYYPIFSKKQTTFTSNNLIATSANKERYEKEVTSYIKENRKGTHLLIVGVNKSKLLILKNKLSTKDESGKLIADNISIMEMSNGFVNKDDFFSKFKLQKPNWVLIADNDKALVDGVFNNVMNLPEEHDRKIPVRVLSFQKSEHIDKLSYKSLSQYNYTYGTDQIEYEEIINDTFEKKYSSKNNQYPTSNALRGFDVTYDAIMRVLKSKNGGSGLNNPSYRNKTAFNYEKDGEKINVNQSVFVNSIESNKEEGFKIIRLR